jgi:drug/metabolite transporter (DMT)-like permease
MAHTVKRRRVLFGVGERWAWVTAVAYTLSNVMMRAAAPQLDGWLGSFLRLLPIAAFGWLMLARTGTQDVHPGNPRFLGWRLIAGLAFGGVVSYVVGTVFFFRALADGGLAISVNAVQGSCVWGGLLLGALMLRERPRWEQLVGCSIIAAGLAIIALSRLDTPGDLWSVGLALAIGAGLAYAAQNAFVRLAQRERDALYPVIACAATAGFVPLLVVILVRAFVDPAGQFAGADPYTCTVALVAGCANGVAVAATAKAVRYVSVGTINAIGSAQIVFSFGASMLIFGESVPPLMLAGVAGVLGGIVIGQTSKTETPLQPALSSESDRS